MVSNAKDVSLLPLGGWHEISRLLLERWHLHKSRSLISCLSRPEIWHCHALINLPETGFERSKDAIFGDIWVVVQYRKNLQIWRRKWGLKKIEPSILWLVEVPSDFFAGNIVLQVHDYHVIIHPSFGGGLTFLFTLFSSLFLLLSASAAQVFTPCGKKVYQSFS